MVDAADSKSATCEGVGVQVPSPVCRSTSPFFLPHGLFLTESSLLTQNSLRCHPFQVSIGDVVGLDKRCAGEIFVVPLQLLAQHDP